MASKIELKTRYGMQTDEFRDLMEFRVQEILLVASHYDTFVLEEDGQLTERLLEEYRSLALSLRFTPHISPVTTGAEALRRIKSGDRSYEMVVVSPRLTDMDVRDFARESKRVRPDLAVCVLAAHAWNLPELEDLQQSSDVDFLFLWQGDVKALLAMIKQVEDVRNADHDVLEGGVQVVILVEDEPRYYSTYLSHIYTEATQQTGRLMAEGLNLTHRLLRIRARPKVLLAQTYEQAWDLFEKYGENVLGLISDIGFPRDGKLFDRAGLELAREVLARVPDVPLLLQSTDKRHREECDKLEVEFLHKRSSNMLDDMRTFMIDHFGFGDFVFRYPDGKEITRARDMREMIEGLREIPEESLLHHADRNHFSGWFKARTEFQLAARLRPHKVHEFKTVQGLREFIISTVTSYLRQLRRNVIIDYEQEHFDEYVAFAKIGSGSLGGKGRGLAFAQKLLTNESIGVPGIEIDIPQTVAVASDVFEEFLAHNGLRKLPRKVDDLSDEAVLDIFRKARFTHERRAEFAGFLRKVTEPLAIRSSSILEDSLYQPFAGVYATVMLPNSHPSLDVRLAQIIEAVKLVYASTFLTNAREYLAGTPHRIEEERMAVLLQSLVGGRHEDLFYPTLSGVASSYNLYPFGNSEPEDGVAQVALGLGKSVVEGFEALRFCPRHPESMPQFSTTKDILRNAQRRFYALDMTRSDMIVDMPPDSNLVRSETIDAVKQGAANMLVSTYMRDDDVIQLGSNPGGSPLITFAPLLRGNTVPLPQVLSRVLELAHKGMECPVEIEFAMQLNARDDGPPVLHLLQIRPLVMEKVPGEMSIDSEIRERALVYSEDAMGHGRNASVTDIVVIHPERVDRSNTRQVATVIEQINSKLSSEGRNYVLIGPGRWGSQDPWLGIPVNWSQISASRAIVEVEFPDLSVDPSYGSHFFQNITCFGIAYLTVSERGTKGKVDWDWLEQQTPVEEALDGVVRHIRVQHPVNVLVDGMHRRGAIVYNDSNVAV